MLELYIPGLGANESKKDSRTIRHDDLATLATFPTLTGGYDYLPEDIQSQHKVGICTAISLTQNAGKALGKKFSAEFQYLLQKKYIDGNWEEGSAVLSALKVGKKYGFLPENEWTHTDEIDRELSYSQYIGKLMSVPQSEIDRLLLLCTDKLAGYASVDLDSMSISKAIMNSRAGILCRYTAGDSWYSLPNGIISWLTKDINPLRVPKNDLSGHAITMAKFDFTTNLDGVLANTWSTQWNKLGLADVILNVYSPTEAWIPFYTLDTEQKKELEKKLEDAQKSLIVLLNQEISILWEQLKNKLGLNSPS